MKASDIMSQTKTCSSSSTVGDAFLLMLESKSAAIPVVDNNDVIGVINSLDIIEHIVPSYITNGYLDSVPYAPDIGMLMREYASVKDTPITPMIDRNPTKVREGDSLISTAASIITHDRHEYALVTKSDKKGLLGIVTTFDILSYLAKQDASDV